MDNQKEIIFPMEQAAAYAQKRALAITGGFVFLYMIVWLGIGGLYTYLTDYVRALINDFSLSLAYIGTILSPIIDFFSLFDFPFFFVIGLFAGIFMHEFLHAVPAAIFSKGGFNAIRFGVYWKYLTPYTHCKEPLRLKKYKIVLITPGVVLGIIPGFSGIVVENFDLMMFGVVFSIGALGDLMVYERIKSMDNNILVKDHPKSMGLILIE